MEFLKRDRVYAIKSPLDEKFTQDWLHFSEENISKDYYFRAKLMHLLSDCDCIHTLSLGNSRNINKFIETQKKFKMTIDEVFTAYNIYMKEKYESK